MTADPFTVAAFYRFMLVDEPARLRDHLASIARESGTCGTVLVAREGINGTIAGTPEGVACVIAAIRAQPGFTSMEVKYSQSAEAPFNRMKVRLKKEIVTLGIPDLDPARDAGTYVKPEDWNALIAAAETVTIDTRNGYEVAIGRFAGAVDPATSSFSDFPAWVEAHRDTLQGKTIAMYCTGGIRCEKATAYMRSIGFEDVRHLEGGILRYLETVPEQDSLWQGECFVFDERVGVTHGLGVGEATLCRACRHPLTEADRGDPRFVEGTSCPHCIGSRTDADRERYAERHRQVALARQRGSGRHIGG